RAAHPYSRAGGDRVCAVFCRGAGAEQNQIRRVFSRAQKEIASGHLPVFGCFRVRAGRAAVRLDILCPKAARMSAFNAFPSILSPSRRSMARLVLPSRLELKRPEGSSSEAPFAKVIFTTLL